MRRQGGPGSAARGWVCTGLALVFCSACALHRSHGRPGVDYEAPPQPPPFSAPLPLDEKEPASGANAPARLLKKTAPVYPKWARDHKIEGTVTIDILVDDQGKVVWWDIMKSIPALDAAAVRCVRQWVFSPALDRGRRVPSIVTAPVTFKMEPRGTRNGSGRSPEA